MTELSNSRSVWDVMDKGHNGSEIEEILRRRNVELEAENKELRERLSQSAGPIIKCGYLYKHRPWARFLEKPWELRFFSLTRSTLTIWKTESEASNHPRGRHLVDDWIIHLGSLRNGKHLTFSIEDCSGAILLELSEGQDAEGGQSWVNALKSLGCKVVAEGGAEPMSSSSNSGTRDGRLVSSEVENISKERDRAPSDLQLRQRKSFLSSRPSTGCTALLQESVSKSSEEKKSKELQTTHTEASVQYTLRPSSPAHKRLRESPLSSDAIFNQSHAGLFNLCIVCLVAVNGRLIIENLMKYGLLMQTGFWFSSKSLKDWPLLMCGLSLPILCLCSFLVEKLAAQSFVPERIIMLAHGVITTISILYPSYIIHRFNSSLLSGFILVIISIVAWMKLISYGHTNGDARMLKKRGEKVEVPEASCNVEYPGNLTVRDLAYFMVAPTLCYQIGYPRSPTIRKGWVLRQTMKLLAFMGLMGFIVEQYINPTIKNSHHPLKGSYLRALERILKLSIPTLYVWLCMFYCFFHLWLNILAEVLRFGDREFYKDWWNAKTVEEYWRMWNMPVHRWMVRHIYFPCLRARIPKQVAFFLVFALSGVFHELCVGIPCHMVRCWAFLGIMLQIPLVFLTNYLQRRYKNLMVGNMIFWFFFCIVGQPMCLLLYYHDVVNQQQPSRALNL